MTHVVGGEPRQDGVVTCTARSRNNRGESALWSHEILDRRACLARLGGVADAGRVPGPTSHQFRWRQRRQQRRYGWPDRRRRGGPGGHGGRRAVGRHGWPGRRRRDWPRGRAGDRRHRRRNWRQRWRRADLLGDAAPLWIGLRGQHIDRSMRIDLHQMHVPTGRDRGLCLRQLHLRLRRAQEVHRRQSVRSRERLLRQHRLPPQRRRPERHLRHRHPYLQLRLPLAVARLHRRKYHDLHRRQRLLHQRRLQRRSLPAL